MRTLTGNISEAHLKRIIREVARQELIPLWKEMGAIRKQMEKKQESKTIKI